MLDILLAIGLLILVARKTITQEQGTATGSIPVIVGKVFAGIAATIGGAQIFFGYKEKIWTGFAAGILVIVSFAISFVDIQVIQLISIAIGIAILVLNIVTAVKAKN